VLQSILDSVFQRLREKIFFAQAFPLVNLSSIFGVGRARIPAGMPPHRRRKLSLECREPELIARHSWHSQKVSVELDDLSVTERAVRRNCRRAACYSGRGPASGPGPAAVSLSRHCHSKEISNRRCLRIIAAVSLTIHHACQYARFLLAQAAPGRPGGPGTVPGTVTDSESDIMIDSGLTESTWQIRAASHGDRRPTPTNRRSGRGSATVAAAPRRAADSESP
jgi:hypothetical protein